MHPLLILPRCLSNMKTLLLSLTLALTSSAWALPPAVYEPIPNTPFWLESDVVQQYPQEAIIRQTEYLKKDNTFFVSPSFLTTAEVAWIEVSGQWLEPRKSPTTATSTNIVVASQNPNLTITSPDGKKTDSSALGTVIVEGSTVEVKEQWAALTLGNLNTLHLMPNTKVKVSFKSEPSKVSTVIQLDSGGVFSKVGKRADTSQDYRVQTPIGIAAARGTDYVTLALPTRMEVWIAEGKVEVLDLKGAKIGEVSASDDTALKVLRTPALTNPKENAEANAAIMTAAFNFVGQSNLENKSIQNKLSLKKELTAEEQELVKNTLPVKYFVKVQKVK